MKRLGQLLLIGLILTLVVIGLNISNEAINQLTASERPALLAVQAYTGQVDIQWVGEHYVVQTDKLSDFHITTLSGTIEKVINYLHKIWVIFKTIFLS